MRYLVTTSRRASPRTRSFAKELAGCLPSSTRINRGKKSLEDLYHMALLEQYDIIIIIAERNGNPSKIVFATPDTSSASLDKLLTLYLKGVSLAREKSIPHRKSKVACIHANDEEARAIATVLSTTLKLPPCPPEPMYRAWISVEAGDEGIVISCLHRGGVSGPSIKVYRYE